jgi:VanZ family protein
VRWLKAWWPAIVWAVVISSFSTGAFTSEHTSRFIVPFLHWLLPHATPETLSVIHHVIRKCGHVTEYFLLSLLVLRGLCAEHRAFGFRMALIVILIVAGYAALDEYHQSFVPGRGAAVSDVLLDTAGGAVAQVMVALFVVWSAARRRERENFAAQSSDAAKRTD